MRCRATLTQLDLAGAITRQVATHIAINFGVLTTSVGKVGILVRDRRAAEQAIRMETQAQRRVYNHT